MMYVILYILAGCAGIFMGFAMASRGSLFTEKVKTVAAAVFYALLLALLIVAILEKSWIIAVLCVFYFIFAPGVGQIIFLLVSRRGSQIGVLSWIMLVLFLGGIAFAAISGCLVG